MTTEEKDIIIVCITSVFGIMMLFAYLLIVVVPADKLERKVTRDNSIAFCSSLSKPHEREGCLRRMIP